MVEAPAQGENPFRRDANDVLAINTAGALAAPRNRVAKMRAGIKDAFIAPAHHFICIESRDQYLAGDSFAPPSAGTQLLGGNMLQIGERLAVPTSHNRRKALVVALRLAKQAE